LRDTSTSESNDPSVNPRTCHSRRLVSALESPNLCPTHHSWMKGSTNPILRRTVTSSGICSGLICKRPLEFNATMLPCFGFIYRSRWVRGASRVQSAGPRVDAFTPRVPHSSSKRYSTIFRSEEPTPLGCHTSASSDLPAQEGTALSSSWVHNIRKTLRSSQVRMGGAELNRFEDKKVRTHKRIHQSCLDSVNSTERRIRPAKGRAFDPR